jgi:hypothetical protein
MSTKETREEARRAIAKELDRLHRKHLQQKSDPPDGSDSPTGRLMHRLSNVRFDWYFS